MAGRAVRWLSWAVVPLALLGYGLYLVLGLSGPRVSGPAAFSPDDAVWVLGQVVYAIVGAIVASRRPELSIGWLFCVAGLLGLVEGIAARAAVYAFADASGSTGGGSGRLAVSCRLVSPTTPCWCWAPAVSVRSATFAWLVGGGLGVGSGWSAGGCWHGAAVASQRH